MLELTKPRVPAQRSKPRRRLITLAALGVALLICAAPSVAAADPIVDQAVAKFNSLGLVALTTFPSGRVEPVTATSAINYGYRTYTDYLNEMNALAAANPTLVEVETAPYPSIEGRPIEYLEITNNVTAHDGKPVLFNMGTIHGNEWPAGEDSLEFAYDVVNQAKTNPAVSALLDHVRLIDMPVVNPDGMTHNRRPNCDSATPLTPPATCPTSSSQGVDMNRNYPLGWGSNVDVTFAQRGSGPGSEPEVKDTMWIIQNHQVVDLLTNHTYEHTILYPPLDLPAGDAPDLNNGYLALGQAFGAQNGYTVKGSGADYQTSGETIDWSYYAARTLSFTMEEQNGGSGCTTSNNASAPSLSTYAPNYVNCLVPDFTGTPSATDSASQIAMFNGKRTRNVFWEALVYASLAGGHSQIIGTAPAGTTLTLVKSFNLYTAPIKNNTTPATTSPPQAIATTLTSTMTVPASGQFTWDVNPSVRPQSAFYPDGEHTGPNGYLQEAWMLSCTAPDGATQSAQVTVDKGQSVTLPQTLCDNATVGASVAPTLSLTLAGSTPSLGAFVPGVGANYTNTVSATTLSTGAGATLTVADPDTTANAGHLVNTTAAGGPYALAQPLKAAATDAAVTTPTYGTVAGAASPLTLLTYNAPVSNDAVTLWFQQAVEATDPLRTGTYSKTLLFTLQSSTL